MIYTGFLRWLLIRLLLSKTITGTYLHLNNLLKMQPLTNIMVLTDILLIILYLLYKQNLIFIRIWHYKAILPSKGAGMIALLTTKGGLYWDLMENLLLTFNRIPIR